MNCPVCDTVCDIITLPCLHEACMACIPIFREQGQACPATKLCRGRNLLWPGETNATALERKRAEAVELDGKLLAAELRFTVASDHLDAQREKRIHNAQNYLARKEIHAKSKMEKYQSEFFISETRCVREDLLLTENALYEFVLGARPPFDLHFPDYMLNLRQDNPYVHSTALQMCMVLSYPGPDEAIRQLGSSWWVAEHAHFAPGYFGLPLKDDQALHWTTERGWEISKRKLPLVKRTAIVYGFTYHNRELVERPQFDPKYAPPKIKLAHKNHEKAMDARRAVYTAETDVLYFEAKCLECDIEVLEMRILEGQVGCAPEVADLPAVKELPITFAAPKKLARHSPYLVFSPASWICQGQKAFTAPLTNAVMLLQRDFAVIHDFTIDGGVRVPGDRAVRISCRTITRGYVAGDTFWFDKATEATAKWKGVSISPATFGHKLDKASRPPEPVYETPVGYIGAMIVRREDTREMLHLAFLSNSAIPHVLGALPY